MWVNIRLLKANSPNEIWHIDLSQIRLEDGSLYYFQAVVDNYSRFLLAWSLSESYSGGATAELIKRAKRQVSLRRKPEVFSDGGRENVNKQIDALVSCGIIDHTVARVEVHFSNSMIESFFWSLKNRYLKHQRLTSFSSLKKHVSFYVKQHNDFIPKYVLNGATPEEAFNRKWTSRNLRALKVEGEAARGERIELNRLAECSKCA